MKTDKIFKQNPELSEYFQTSDGQAFYTAEAARMHAKSLADKSVKHVVKGAGAEETEKNPAEPKKPAAEEPTEREALIARYTELYGKAPAKNAKDETLQARIEEKETELKAQADETED